ncbi:uncharacterized protein LOC116223158 [Clupea harengus]|uniref:Uncharacterized protein LOC116223158 n=1 Tax=Clupea harengus TaxID=7950 RepID=A0A6P8GGQ3_CLUHA|nr:uncharacterized protein LOC116223158 [Clupea harengus]
MLLLHLKKGVPPIQLCLHERDFEAGKLITSNIVDEGIIGSRNVIVVVTQHFIDSSWCRFEFELAQSWLVLGRNTSIIIIILEDVEDKKIKRRLSASEKPPLQWFMVYVTFCFCHEYCATQIRVVNGDNSCSGRVEIYHHGEWGTICDDSWDLSDAEVVCRQLGCGKALRAPPKAYFGQGSGKIWLDDVQCSVDSSIQLANSSGYCSGRVEIYHNGEWGTVCDDSWDIYDTEVVCRQLGCGKALHAPREAYFGQGSGTTWLDEVLCSGTESSITQCSHNGFGNENCNPSEDAGVVCIGNIKTPTLALLTTNTALLPGESAEFRCAITSHRPVTANFRLYRNEIYMQTKTADQNMMTFSLSSLASSDQGSYTCDYYYQGTLTISSSKSNAITITIVSLHVPRINCTAPEGGLSWGPSGLEITKGYSFSITCSTQPQFPGGVFHLSFSGSNSTMTQPATNHSAFFYFPAADYSHQGNYSCVYHVDLPSRHLYSTETEKLTVTIREFMVPFIAAGVTGGVVLLLLFGLVCIFWARRKQTNRRQTTWKHIRGQSKLNTHGKTRLDQNEQKKGEDEDGEDNARLDPRAEEDDCEDEDQDVNVEMEDQDNCEDEYQDEHVNVEIEDQDDCEDEYQDEHVNVEIEDQDDCEDEYQDEHVEMEDQDDCEDEYQDEHVEMEDQDDCEDEYQDEHVEMEDQDDCEDEYQDDYVNVEIEDQGDYENVED